MTFFPSVRSFSPDFGLPFSPTPPPTNAFLPFDPMEIDPPQTSSSSSVNTPAANSSASSQNPSETLSAFRPFATSSPNPFSGLQSRPNPSMNPGVSFAIPQGRPTGSRPTPNLDDSLTPPFIKEAHEKGLPGTRGWFVVGKKQIMFNGLDLYTRLQDPEQAETSGLNPSQEDALETAKNHSQVFFAAVYPGENKDRLLPSTTVGALRGGIDLPFLSAYFRAVSTTTPQRDDCSTLARHYREGTGGVKIEPPLAAFWWKKTQEQNHDPRLQPSYNPLPLPPHMTQSSSASSALQKVSAITPAATEESTPYQGPISFNLKMLTQSPSRDHPTTVTVFSQKVVGPIPKSLAQRITDAFADKIPYILSWVMIREKGSKEYTLTLFDGANLHECFARSLENSKLPEPMKNAEEFFFAAIYPGETEFRPLPTQTKDILRKTASNTRLSIYCPTLSPSTSSNPSDGCYLLGNLYYRGDEKGGVEKDLKLAEFWWKKDADEKCPDCSFALAHYHRLAGRKEEGIKFLKQAADLGNEKAICEFDTHLDACSESGRGIPYYLNRDQRNLSQASQLLTAAKRQMKRGLNPIVGSAYEAVKLLVSVAEKGDAEAEYQLGLTYMDENIGYTPILIRRENIARWRTGENLPIKKEGKWTFALTEDFSWKQEEAIFWLTRATSRHHLFAQGALEKARALKPPNLQPANRVELSTEYTISINVSGAVRIWSGDLIETNHFTVPETCFAGVHRPSGKPGAPSFKTLIDQAMQEKRSYLLGWLFDETPEGRNVVLFDGLALYESFTKRSNHPDFSAKQQQIAEDARKNPAHEVFFAALHPDKKTFEALPPKTVDAVRKGDPNNLMSIYF